VLDHLAKPLIKSGGLHPWTEDVRKLAAFPNVLCKLSGMVTEADWQHWKPEDMAPYLDVAFGAFGPERLMIGSDWPVCTVAASYGRAMAVVKDYLGRHSVQVQNAVMGENAQRFWKLKLQ